MEDFFQQLKQQLQSNHIFCNSLFAVYIFRLMFPDQKDKIYDGFLNVTTKNDSGSVASSFSIRHYYFIIDSVTYDPIVFVPKTQELIENTCISKEPMYNVVTLENEELREHFYKNTNIDGYFSMCHPNCYFTMERLLTLFSKQNLKPSCNRVIRVNDRCPCGSLKKYKKCHMGIFL
jgi:hypothetical protein